MLCFDQNLDEVKVQGVKDLYLVFFLKKEFGLVTKIPLYIQTNAHRSTSYKILFL